MPFQMTEQEKTTYLKYAKLNLPRHTSYPAAPFWQSQFPLETVQRALEELSLKKYPLSLYLHIPYCKQLCFYCACNKEIYPDERMQKNDPRERLVEALIQEMHFYSAHLGKNPVAQIHFGGGTPTFLSPAQLQKLFAKLFDLFTINADAEISVEIDPRVTSYEHLAALKASGCNRLSLGVQDFSPEVQKAINRIQPYDLVAKTMADCRKLGFKSVNFDLIYGLPFQTKESMQETLELTHKLSPDRIAFYRLALIPEMFKWQKAFGREHLPSEEDNLSFFLNALNFFTESDYEFIGLDHFAKKSELLSEAMQSRTLRRNFQGMTTGQDLAIIGMGPSAISQIPAYYWQNEKKTELWLKALTTKEDLFEKGCSLSQDDIIRQAVIQELYCYGRIDWQDIDTRFDINSNVYFKQSTLGLDALSHEGIISKQENEVSLSPILGRLLVRLIASQYDYYLQEKAAECGTKFSQVG